MKLLHASIYRIKLYKYTFIIYCTWTAVDQLTSLYNILQKLTQTSASVYSGGGYIRQPLIQKHVALAEEGQSTWPKHWQNKPVSDTRIREPHLVTWLCKRRSPCFIFINVPHWWAITRAKPTGCGFPCCVLKWLGRQSHLLNQTCFISLSLSHSGWGLWHSSSWWQKPVWRSCWGISPQRVADCLWWLVGHQRSRGGLSPAGLWICQNGNRWSSLWSGIWWAVE